MSLQVLPRLLMSEFGYHCRKLLPASHRGGMVRAPAGLANGQGAFEDGPSAVQVALLAQDRPKPLSVVAMSGWSGPRWVSRIVSARW